MHDWGYILAFLSWSYSICNSYSLIKGFYAAAFFFFNIHTKFQILLYLTCFSMLTPGSFLHSTTGISIFLTWIFNSVVSLDLCAPSGMLHLFLSFFFFLSPCWLFYGGFWISRGHLTGSSLQWDHKHCRKICSLLQHCFSSPWLSSQGIPFWQ